MDDLAVLILYLSLIISIFAFLASLDVISCAIKKRERTPILGKYSIIFWLVSLLASINIMPYNYHYLDFLGYSTITDMPDGRYKGYVSLTDSSGHEYIYPCVVDDFSILELSINGKNVNTDFMEFYYDRDIRCNILDKDYDAHLIDVTCPVENRLEMDSSSVREKWIEFYYILFCFLSSIYNIYALTKKTAITTT